MYADDGYRTFWTMEMAVKKIAYFAERNCRKKMEIIADDCYSKTTTDAKY